MISHLTDLPPGQSLFYSAVRFTDMHASPEPALLFIGQKFRIIVLQVFFFYPKQIQGTESRCIQYEGTLVQGKEL